MLSELLYLVFFCCNVAYSGKDTSILETNFIVNDTTSMSEPRTSINDANSTLAASYPFDLYEGQEFMVKLSNKHLDDMTACIITNQQSMMEAHLLPPKENSSISGVFYWGGGWSSHECGVRITNVTGISTWILSALKNNETIYKETILLRSKPVPESKEYHESVWVGKHISLALASALPELYCSVKHPSGDKEVTIYGLNCIYNIPSVSGYDEGLWTASVGISHLIRELEFKTDVEVKAAVPVVDGTIMWHAQSYITPQILSANIQAGYFTRDAALIPSIGDEWQQNYNNGERVVAGWRNSSTSYTGAVDLYCALVDQPPNKSPSATYCHFIRPNDNVGFLMNEGIGNGKYSYYGNGLNEYECGVTIEKPEQEDIGVWQCIIGFESSYNATLISFYPTWMQSLRGVRKEPTPTQRVINVINGSDISLMCSASEALHYCFMVAPDGSQYPGDGKLLGIGTCQVVVQSVNERHSGQWSCLMGPRGGGKELSEKISVTVTTTKMISVDEAVTASVGGRAVLRCQSIPDGSFSESAVDYSTLVRSSLTYCRFGHPSGISMTLNDNSSSPVEQRFRYYGKGLQDGECGILIDPVSIQDGGEWICAGVAGINDMESRATITLDITDSTEMFPGSALVEPNEEVILQMKGRHDDQVSCSVVLPSGHVVNLNSTKENPVSYWGEGIEKGYCGVKIKGEALQRPTDGYEMWTLVSNNSHSISTKAVAWVGVKGPNSRRMRQAATHTHVVELGGKLVLNCSKEDSVYCLIVPPGGDSKHYNPGRCTRTLESVSSLDLGVWTCYIGLPTTTRELVETIELTARATSLSANVKTTSRSIEMSCTIDYPLKYCRFVDPRGASIIVREGFINERLSYSGQGLQKGHCGLRISPVSEEDYGVWMCFAGVNRQDSVEHQVDYITLSKEEGRSALAATVTRKEVIAVERSGLTLECEYSTSLAYCWLLHPNGTQLVPVPASNTELQMGICRLTLPEVQLEDAGRWACHMGTLGSYGQETEVHIDVEIKGSPLYAAQTSIVTENRNSTTAMCYTVPGGAKLDYCRFLRPDGKGFSLNQDMRGAAMGRYRYYGEGLNKGHCGVIIDQLTSEDLGQWYCAAVLHGTSKEASTSFMVKLQETKSDDSLVWIIPTGVVAVVIVAVGIIIAYIMRWRKQARLGLPPNTPVGPRVSDTSSESSIFSRD